MTTTTNERLLDVAEVVLAEAILHLRHAPDYSREEVANDLALLCERLKLRDPAYNWRTRHLRVIKRDELADEVLRGEHDDHDWQMD